VQGPQGVTGVQGPQGATGPQGVTGIQGPQGAQGVTGVQGVQGPVGATGVAGLRAFTYYSIAAIDILDTAPTINSWASGASYTLGNVRQYSSKVYVALQNMSGRTTTPDLDTDYWQQIFSGPNNETNPSFFTNLTPTLFLTTQGYWLTVAGGLSSAEKEYRWYIDATVAGVTEIKWTITALETDSANITQDDFQEPVLIQGPKGEQGLQGATGATGPQGVTGVQGPQGPQGVTGVQGPQGATGPQGVTGVQGPQGATGPQGVTGVQGPQGATGPQGVTGVQGPDGPTGPRGATGPQGVTGVQGPDGPTGPRGVTGPQGITGAQGLPGSTGPTGVTGPVGPAGEPGATIAFDTSTTIASDSTKTTLVESLKNGESIAAGDIYWHVETDRTWKYSGTIWNELAKVGSGYTPGALSANSVRLSGTNSVIEIRDGSGIVRVKIGNLSA
jgi:hypothetical protein